MTISMWLYIFAGAAAMGAIQERSDKLRMAGFLAVAAIFAVVGLAIAAA